MDLISIGLVVALVAFGLYSYRQPLLKLIRPAEGRGEVLACQHELDDITTLRHMEEHYTEAAPTIAKQIRGVAVAILAREEPPA